METKKVYNRVTPEILEKLREIIGQDGVTFDSFVLEKYSHDETEDLQYMPEVVVLPADTAQISQILQLCSEHRIPVTPRAGGTGLSGGALAAYGGVLLSVEKLNHILEIDRDNLMAVVEPGVITEVLQNEAERHGLFYPPDPASKGSCCIGGNVAECAGGPRALKYGVTKDYVYGLEVVLPSGEIIQTGGKLLKNVTGYNLTQLMVGSEGTLGIVTKIILKLVPLPTHKRTLLVPFSTIRDAAGTVAAIFQAGITPSAVEFMEQEAILVAEQRMEKKFPYSEAPALLLIEVDGPDAQTLEKQTERIGEVALERNATDVYVADSPEKQAYLWAMRRSIGESVKAISAYKEEDTVVPRARLPELMDVVADMETKYGLRAICYGHAGDGNIHVNILKQELPDEVWNRILPQAVNELFTKVFELGGTLSGEHGIGLVQKGYMPIVMEPAQLRLMREIKRVFDPHNILNPGKIFPEGV
ncbi:MAG TPA: FAD-linked oxidase C-terminal domain-containing protein [Acidobacteriota bacterium]|nr:FAD-linked oxidase C-terminal domain-containing protein [Acidobacteriota bacterium]